MPRFWQFWGRRPPAPESDRALDALLEAEVRRTRGTDPGTGERWQMLSRAMDKREREPVHGLQGGTASLRRPAGATGRIMPRPAVAFALASLALVVISAGILWLREPRTLAYETGRGQQTLVTLADSSQISLNHTSLLTVIRRPLDPARRVRLTGEAYFRVRRSGSPFIVQTDAGSVRVLGTEFNIRVRGDTLEVAVLHGSVAVSASQAGRDSTVVLQAGQITLCQAGAFPPAPSPLPFTEYPAWTHEKLLFYRTDVSSACREIESRFDVTVRLERHRSAQELLTGRVDARNAESAVRTLALLTGSQYRHDGSEYVLY